MAKNISLAPHYKYNVFKQQTVTTSAAVVTPLAASDAIVGRPENIFVQALSTNTSPIYISNSSGVTAAGASIELTAGANLNLPAQDYANWYAICTSGSQKLNIVYQAQVE